MKLSILYFTHLDHIFDQSSGKTYTRTESKLPNGDSHLKWTNFTDDSDIDKELTKELEKNFQLQIGLKNKVIQIDETLWMVEEATDFECALNSISMARATGSVGNTEIHQSINLNSNPTILRKAKVVRIEKIKAQ